MKYSEFITNQSFLDIYYSHTLHVVCKYKTDLLKLPLITQMVVNQLGI